MDPDTLELLRTADGITALAAARLVVDERDPLTAASALRSAGIEAQLASAALTQQQLRLRATTKFGADAATMFFTRPGLEQATRAPVARRRAERLARAGVRRVADLGCGIGADTLAFARAGMAVLAVDADPTVAAVARANVAAAGLAGLVEVRCADATEVDLSTVDAVFCDPARRDSANGRRVFDPSAYQPAWSFVVDLPRRVPLTVLKLAPGLDHHLIPAGAEAEWVSVDGAVVELTAWCGPLSTVPRRASLLRHAETHSLTGDADRPAPLGDVGRYVYDVDGAVVRAHLVAGFADLVHGRLADPRICYVFADSPTPTPYGRCLEVTEELPFALKRLRAALRARDIGTLEILKRGVAVDPAQLRRDLHLAGAHSASLLVARVARRPLALLCQPRPRP